MSEGFPGPRGRRSRVPPNPGLNWRSLEYADADAIGGDIPGDIVVSSVDGLWTVQYGVSAGSITGVVQFNKSFPSASREHVILFRFTEFTTPAAQEDQLVYGGGLPNFDGVGYQYVSGAATVKAAATVDELGGDYVSSATLLSADLEEVSGVVAGSPDGISASSKAKDTGAGVIEKAIGSVSMGAKTQIVVRLRRGAGTLQTLKFRPEYALVDLSTLLTF